jgi:hypothetical protein
LQSWTAVEDDKPIGQINLAHTVPEGAAARARQEHSGGDIDRFAIPVRLLVDPDHGKRSRTPTYGTAVTSLETEGSRAPFYVTLRDQTAIRLCECPRAVQVATLTHHYGDGLIEPPTVHIFCHRDK